MSYVALYRKFRPTTFSEVKGQEHITETLQNQLKAGRTAHAYLFCGTRGTGKTTVAKILARAVNCEDPQEDGSPCNVCASCASILAGTSTNVIEIDAASNNGVENIREIREEVVYRPAQGRYKVYIIDEVHMLSTGAWNALLKTLEEPPEYVIFILATTEVHKIPVTITSRCQRYNFRRITVPVIAARLQELIAEEGAEAEEAAVRYIARAADGSMRDALSLLDQCMAFYMGEALTYGKVLDVLGTVDTEVFSGLLRKIIAGDAAGAVRMLQEIIQNGKEVAQFVSDLTWYLRNLILVQNSQDLEDVLDVSAENLQQLREESAMADQETLMRYIYILSDLSGQLRTAVQKQTLTELALLRLCRPQTDTDLLGILDRVRALEQKVEEGIPLRAAEPAPAREDRRTEKRAAEKPPEPVRKAAPEDLKKIAAAWPKILTRVDYPMRTVLDQAGPPRYDSATGEGGLYVEVGDETSLGILRDPEHIEQLRGCIDQTIGETLSYTIEIVGRSHGKQLDTIPLEKKLAEEIHMPITEI